MSQLYLMVKWTSFSDIKLVYSCYTLDIYKRLNYCNLNYLFKLVCKSLRYGFQLLQKCPYCLPDNASCLL